MRRISELFDFFKEAYRLNKANKVLYRPQILLIIIRTLLYIAVGILAYKTVIVLDQMALTQDNILNVVFGLSKWLVVVVVAFWLLNILFTAGTFEMYKEAFLFGETKRATFDLGVKRNFLAFIGIDLLMLVFWLVALIPYIILSIVSLGVGFVLIPIVVSIFTVMWRITYVMEEMTVMGSFKNGFNIAKKNFVPVAALVIIQNAFLNMGGSSSGGSSGGNISDIKSINQKDILGSNMGETLRLGVRHALDQLIPALKMALLIIIPITSLILIIYSLIKMVILVFFELSFFAMYDGYTHHEIQPTIEGEVA